MTNYYPAQTFSSPTAGMAESKYALRYGVPVVATGGKEDKPEVGARVAWSGAGHRIRSEHPTPRDLHGAIHAVLSVSGFRRPARGTGAQLPTPSGSPAVGPGAQNLPQ